MTTKSNTLPKEDTSTEPETSSLLDSKPSVPITPTTDRALKEKLDYFYSKTKSEMNDEEIPWQLKGFKSLLEVIESKPVIVQALEKLKRNDGSMTAGVDKKTIRDFLELPFDELVEYVRKSLRNYTPDQVKRVWIDKPGKKEKRPLGIPTIGDRIIQECVRIVIEPILEAQFWDHSYGFRPHRDQHHALCKNCRRNLQNRKLLRSRR